jgi:hypothetical protein
MSNEESRPLAKWREISTIFSLIATPVILAAGGWWIQNRIAEQGTQNQYVQIATGILATAPPQVPTNEQRELRDWAASIIDLYAPIKLTQVGRDALLRERLKLDDPMRWRDLEEGNCRAFIITRNEEAFRECMDRRHAQSEKMIQDELKMRGPIATR